MQQMYERFSQYVKLKGLSFRRLAERSGVSVSIVSRFASGQSITSDNLKRIVDVCDDLSLDWLFTGSGSMFRGTSPTSDVLAGGSVMVKNSRGVSVPYSGMDSRLLEMIREKDLVIAEKDRVIGERDRTIERMQRILLDKAEQ